MKIRFRLISYIILCLLIASSCSEPEELRLFEPEGILYIGDYLEENGDRFDNYLKLVEETGIYASLQATNPAGNNLYTLFLPNDSAFNLFFIENETYKSIDDLLSDEEFAGILVRYHLVMSGLSTNDFVFGALTDSTGTGDFLTVGAATNMETSESSFIINNRASVLQPNIELTNGYIHVIDQVLEPVIYTGYQWLSNNPDFSIFVQLFDVTGLKDKMGLFIINEIGESEENLYTILAESNDLYSRYGIQNFEDLIAFIDPQDGHYMEENNAVYQYAAYHLLEGSLFINELESGTYPTFTNFPIRIDSEIEIEINPGIHGDSTYIPLILEESNINTKNGPVHLVDSILEVFNPGISRVDYEFYNEPIISEISKTEGEYEFKDPGIFTQISWSGSKHLYYYNEPGNQFVTDDDYLFISGPFNIQCTTDKISPGEYHIKIITFTNRSTNAYIQVYLDGVPMGAPVDLTRYYINGEITVGRVVFDEYKTHKITVEAIIPGNFYWDYTRFEPVSD